MNTEIDKKITNHKELLCKEHLGDQSDSKQKHTHTHMHTLENSSRTKKTPPIYIKTINFGENIAITNNEKTEFLNKQFRNTTIHITNRLRHKIDRCTKTLLQHFMTITIQ